MKWEYLTAQGTKFSDDTLNKYGEEGWELVSVTSNVHEWVLVFKRPKATP